MRQPESARLPTRIANHVIRKAKPQTSLRISTNRSCGLWHIPSMAQQTRAEFFTTEQPLVSEQFQFGGTLDWVGLS